MPISYAIDPALGIIFETWTGTVHAGDLADFWRNYLADPEVLACRRTLVDLRECGVEVHGSDLANLIETIVLPKLGTMKWRSALLVGHAIQFGVARQYEVFADYYSRDSVFTDRQAAVSWLLQDTAETE